MPNDSGVLPRHQQTQKPSDHLQLLGAVMVCQEHSLHLKVEKCEVMQKEMECLGFGYGWWDQRSLRSNH